jgi:hypothetical protein
MRMSKRLGTLVAIAGVVAVGLFALPHPAQAYWVWRGGVQVWVPALLLRAAAGGRGGAAPHLGAGALARRLLGARPLGVRGLSGQCAVAAVPYGPSAPPVPSPLTAAPLSCPRAAPAGSAQRILKRSHRRNDSMRTGLGAHASLARAVTRPGRPPPF